PSIITYPIFDSGQELDDGWVLLMNDAARAAFSYRQPIGNLRLRELPLFQFGQLWAQLRARYASANPHATVSLDRVELDLIKVKRLLALRFGLVANASGALAYPFLPAFVRLEPGDRGANRRERAVFVLGRAEAIGIGTIGRVDRLLQQVGKILVQIRFARA